MTFEPAPIDDPGACSFGLATAPPMNFSEIYRREKPRLLRYFFQKLGNRADADDLAQEALTRYLKATPSASVITPRAYLTRIATNLLKDHSQRGSTRLGKLSVPLDEGLNQAANHDPHREVGARQELVRWQEILNELAPRTLDIFHRNRVEGYSYKQISLDLGIPLWMVQKHMLRAIRHVAAHQELAHE